jgi:ferredoxin
MTKIFHYREKCIGCNSCVEIDHNRWKICGRDGKSKLIGGKEKGKVHQIEIDDVERENAEKAAECCPVKIIKVED